jgi:hypothetical protein
VGIWVKHFKRVRRLLDEGKAEVTHTLEQVVAETGTTDKSVLSREPSWWKQIVAGTQGYQAAVNEGVAVTPHVDERNLVVSVTYRLLGRTTE